MKAYYNSIVVMGSLYFMYCICFSGSTGQPTEVTTVAAEPPTITVEDMIDEANTGKGTGKQPVIVFYSLISCWEF